MTESDYKYCFTRMTASFEGDLKDLKEYTRYLKNADDIDKIADYRAWDLVYFDTKIEEEDIDANFKIDDDLAAVMESYERAIKSFQESKLQ